MTEIYAVGKEVEDILGGKVVTVQLDSRKPVFSLAMEDSMSATIVGFNSSANSPRRVVQTFK